MVGAILDVSLGWMERPCRIQCVYINMYTYIYICYIFTRIFLVKMALRTRDRTNNQSQPRWQAHAVQRKTVSKRGSSHGSKPATSIAKQRHRPQGTISLVQVHIRSKVFHRIPRAATHCRCNAHSTANVPTTVQFVFVHLHS